MSQEVLLKPREEVLTSFKTLQGYHAYGWPVDDERGVYFIQPDVVCLDVEGNQLGVKRKLVDGDEKGSLSEFLLPSLSTALTFVSHVATEAGVKAEVKRTDSIGEFGAYREEIDPRENRFATHYPGLEGYLVMRLRELGEVEISKSPVKSITAKIKLHELPNIIDGHDSEGRIWINSDAGGCSVGNVSCRQLPTRGNHDCAFDFVLSLDSQWVKPELHSPEFLMDRIDEFVRKAKVGFSYSFSGCFVDPSIRTSR